VPDVVVLSYWDEASFVERGDLLDLTPYIQMHAGDLVDYKMFECWQDGEYVCVPWDGGPMVLYYRRDVFEAAGLPTDPDEVDATIATWSDFYETCWTIKANTGSYCFALNKANNWGFLYHALLWQQKGGYFDPDTGDVTIDSPDNVAMLEMLGQFWRDDLVSDALQRSQAWFRELASPDQPVATLISSPWVMNHVVKPVIGASTYGKWGVARLPAYEDGGERAVGAANWGNTWVSAVTKQSPNPHAAWAFIEFTMLREESQRRMLSIDSFIPTLKALYDDPEFLEGDAFYAGQDVRRVYAEANRSIPRSPCWRSPIYEAGSAVENAIRRYATGKLTAQGALQQAAEEIRDRRRENQG
jgi:ABC-type glycerol-3-phosphate transport system substrate-binding protein